MTHRPHDLADDFPTHAEAIAALRQSDGHFARLAADYQEVNNRIHLWESNLEPMEDLAMIEARKQRAALKDRIWAQLQLAQPTS